MKSLLFEVLFLPKPLHSIAVGSSAYLPCHPIGYLGTLIDGSGVAWWGAVPKQTPHTFNPQVVLVTCNIQFDSSLSFNERKTNQINLNETLACSRNAIDLNVTGHTSVFKQRKRRNTFVVLLRFASQVNDQLAHLAVVVVLSVTAPDISPCS